MKTALLYVGGNWNNSSNAGVRAANANNSAGNANNNIGFRACNCVNPSRPSRHGAGPADTHTTPDPCAWREPGRTSNPPATVSSLTANPEVGITYNVGGTMPKRRGGLWQHICTFDNLYLAYERARRGKRYRPEVLRYGARLGENLLALQDELVSLAWQPGAYQVRVVLEPKERIIRVAPFRDRVVHQAICCVMAPVFERGFIHDSYACREGRGTHRALDRLTSFLRRGGSAYVLNADVRKFFDSISHAVLRECLEHVIKDRELLTVLERIIASYAPETQEAGLHDPHGIPIGNLTSQWFANIVGNRIDHFAKHELGCRSYLRYMDNMLFLSDDKDELWEYQQRLTELLAGLGLVLNPKTTIAPTAQGVPFLGLRVFPDHRRVLRPNVVRGRRRMRGSLRALAGGEAQTAEVASSTTSWIAHLAHADTYRLRAALADEYEPYLGRL